MDNYRLDEVASRFDEPAEDETRVAYEARIKDKITSLEERIIRLEERINLMMALKVNGLDISKFSFGIAPL